MKAQVSSPTVRVTIPAQINTKITIRSRPQSRFLSPLTSVASSLGYVSRKMANPWKLSLLPKTGPEGEIRI